MQARIIFVRKLKRIYKVILGSYNTFFKRGNPYKHEWWDEEFYTNGISDEKTIGPRKDIFSSKYHYSSVEMLILRQLVNRHISEIDSVLDLGSGAGHWMDFFLSLGTRECTGIEVSDKCIQFLEQKYKHTDNVEIIRSNIQEYIEHNSDKYFDIINAVGIMFHIISDRELEEVLNLVYRILNTNGLFIITGNFNYWPFNINSQVTRGQINKRLRSRIWWIRRLKKIGYKKINITRNLAYMFIDGKTPENNVLTCTK